MQVYEMSWREFQLRSYGFKRADKAQWVKVREIAYNSLIGSHLDPKKLPKTREKYLPLDAENAIKGVSDERKEMFLKAFKNYLNERKVTV
jgi:hypothetical protein